VKTRVMAFLAALAVSAGILAGCAGTPSEISSAVSTELQTTVVAIADAAAAGDAATALAELDQLQQQLDAALADGSVSSERAAAIQTRIDLVRADLQPEPVVEPAPETTTAPTTGTVDGGEENPDEGNSGPGNNNGNDKGHDKGNDKGNGNGKGGD
jgi:hypothetical protein